MGSSLMSCLLVAILALSTKADDLVMPHHSVGPIVPSSSLRYMAMPTLFFLEVQDGL